MNRYYGREQIFTDEREITKENVVRVIQDSLKTHRKNKGDINYLYNYYRGKHPVRNRVKNIRPDIKNMITENIANEIVSFKVGYLCGSPIQYVSGNTKDDVSEKIDTLNQLMEAKGKSTKDKDLFEWQMIGGTSYRIVLPRAKDFSILSLDPRYTFVIYRNSIEKEPLAAVYITEATTTKGLVELYTVYTSDTVYEVKDQKVVSVSKHIMGTVPIIEYPANNARLGAFEIVLDLMDAIDEIDSDRLDGLQQFIQSLMVIYNAHLEDDTANSIREKGLIELKSVGDAKADIKIISEQLNQDQTQTLKKDIMQRIREIVGLPSQGDGTTGDSSNNGAAFLKNGWENAETRAKESEIMFKQSEQEFLKIILSILSTKNKLSLNLEDIDIRFTRRNYENIQVKSQVLTTMLSNDKIAPKLAFQSCGLFIDAEEAYRESKEYYDRRVEQPTIESGENSSEIPEERRDFGQST